jgi:thiol-disulfide isomerase/thioredoxin
VLVGATAFGLARRRSDGKLRARRVAGPQQSPGPQQSAGQEQRPGGPEQQPQGSQREGSQPQGRRRERRLSEADLGHPLGERATLLQFSSSFCAPCRSTRQVLGDVASSTDGVAHVEIDVADRVDLVRVLDVRRTPTMFLLDSEGRVTARASGAPRKEDVLAALGVEA